MGEMSRNWQSVALSCSQGSQGVMGAFYLSLWSLRAVGSVSDQKGTAR